jgi:hypothetical protein
MLRVAALLAWFAVLASPFGARAQDRVTISVEVVQDTPSAEPGNDRFVVQPASEAAVAGVAAFGPFRVLDAGRAALVGATDAATPRDFARMLLAFPGLRALEMIECPGTSDDTANLRLGRMIRRAGLDTHVPARGSVRSGAVELFLAGKRRSAEPGAEFAVHSWQDVDGREADDVAAEDPVNLAYLAYYREMGLSEAQARRFYAMTNSVPHKGARWLSPAEFAAYAPLN